MHLYLEDNIESHCKVRFDEFIIVYEEINHELWRLYGLQQTTKAELRYQRFYKAFLHFGFDNVALAHKWADDYLTISPYKTHLVEGALEVLNYLKQTYTLHLITNGFKEVQHIKLDTCGLNSFFDQIIISEDHGFNKPDIKIFELAERMAGVNKTACVMIGDNYDADIAGAKNAGWKAIHLTPEINKSEDHLQIKSLIELLKLF